MEDVTKQRKEISNALKKAREDSGATRYRVAVANNMEQTQIRSIEDGKAGYTVDSLIKLCNAYGMDIKIVRKK